jgi:hypothetical protein
MELQAKDLRIGNWVESYLPPQISEWIEVEVSPHTLIKMRDHEMKHGFRPIPLTEDWSVKFGLYNNLKLNYNKRQGVEYRFSKKKLGTYIIKRYYNNSLYKMQFVYDDKHNNIPNEQIWVNIKYVHQLQNLYFALTGEELTIKE